MLLPIRGRRGTTAIAAEPPLTRSSWHCAGHGREHSNDLTWRSRRRFIIAPKEICGEEHRQISICVKRRKAELMHVKKYSFILFAFASCIILSSCGGTGGGSAAGSGPGSATPPQSASEILQLLMMDGAHVASVRDSLRKGEAQYTQALTVLQADADHALTIAPMSVMDKGVTPPSGDKHDYMSQAPYWWPDPSKPNGLPYIEKDGQRNPEVDRITDHEDLGRLGNSVSTLGLAFYFTGRADYAQQAARLVRVWFLDSATRMNPNLDFAQGIPGIAKGRSAGIIESRFLPDIIDGVTLLHGSQAWTVPDDQAFKNWMSSYLEWLLVSAHGRDEAKRGNNQETWYDVQVVGLAVYTGAAEVARKTLEAARTEIGQQFQPDGKQPRELARTRAWDYSIFNLTAYMHVAALGGQLGVDLWNYRTADGRSLRQGVEYLIPFATGDKHFPHQQITAFHASALHLILRWAALGWNDPRYRDIARQIGGATAKLDLTLP
jgi:hypothetical protein